MKTIAIFLLLLPIPSWGMIALDKNATSYTTSLDHVTVTVTPAAGSYVLVWSKASWNFGTPSCACAGATCSFTNLYSHISDNPNVTLFGMVNAPAGVSAITCTYSGAGVHSVAVVSFTGVDTSIAVDQLIGTATRGISGTWATSGVATTEPTEVVVAMGATGNDRTISSPPGAPWNALESRTSSQGFNFGYYQIVSSTGTYSAAATLSSSDSWKFAIISLKAPGDGGGLVARRRIIN